MVAAFRGVTLLGPGARRLGFTVCERPLTIRRRFERIFFAGLLLLYSGDGLKRIEYGSTLSSYPGEVDFPAGVARQLRQPQGSTYGTLPALAKSREFSYKRYYRSVRSSALKQDGLSRSPYRSGGNRNNGRF